MSVLGKFKFLLFIFLLLGFISQAQQQYRPYPGAQLRNSPTDFPPAFDCSMEIDFKNNFSIREAARAELTTLDYATPIVGDITGDGIVEILVLEYAQNFGRPNYTNKTRNILVYRMINEELVVIGKIETPFVSIEGPTPFLITKVQGVGNGNPIVVVATSHDKENGPLASKLIAYQWNGGGFNQVWVSNEAGPQDGRYGRNVPLPPPTNNDHVTCCGLEQEYQFRSGAAPAVADFNGDGVPEIYIYNEIFDARDGRFIVDGGANGQGISQVSPGGFGNMFAGAMGVSVAADLNNNGNLELAAGKTVYLVDLSTPQMIPISAPSIGGTPPRDGFTSIADIDQDGQLDIVVTTSLIPSDIIGSLGVYVWTLPGNGSPLETGIRASVNPDSPTAPGISLAFIGDINGDNRPNIGFTTSRRLWMYEYNGTTLVPTTEWPITTNDRSGHTLITMFDFNQNGQQELVYRDETSLRIMGPEGTNLAVFPSSSNTASEGAIVADVDGDGEAEILVTSRDAEGDDVRPARLIVYKSEEFPWAPARKVWNQYAYFSFNVNEDLSIPAPQPNHALTAGVFFPRFDEFGCLDGDERPFNNFLVQTTLFNEGGCFITGVNLMDAQIEIVNANFSCPSPDNRVSINVIIYNQSDAVGDETAGIPLDTPIAFYIDGVFIGSRTPAELGLQDEIMPGQVSPELEISFDINILDNLSGEQVVSAIINWDDAAQAPVYDECNYDNTSNEFLVITRPLYEIDAPGAQCFEDGSGNPSSFTLLSVNTVDGAVDSDQLIWFKDGDQVTSGTFDGVVFDINPTDFSLTIIGLPASSTPYTFVLLDECTGRETEVQLTVDPSPTVSLEVTDVSCESGNDGRITAVTGHQDYITYSLDNGASFLTLDQLLAQTFGEGSYSLIARAMLNPPAACLSEVQFTIEAPPAIVAGANGSEPVTCEQVNNGSIFFEFSGGTAPYTFVDLSRNGTVLSGITHESTNDRFDFTGLEAGDYSMSAVDANGCPLPSVTVTVEEIPVPVVSLNVDGQCFGAGITIDAELTVAGGLTSPTYTWFAPDGQQLTEASGNLNLGGSYELIAGGGINPPDLLLNGIAASGNPYEFKLELRGELSCDTDFMVDVTVNPSPEPEFAKVDITCYDSQTGKITVSNEQTSYVYYISGTIFDGSNYPETRFAGKAALESAFFKAGQYTIKTVNENGTNCETIDNIEILGPPGPIVLEDDFVIIGTSCNEDNGIIQNVSITGGWGNYTVKWRKDNAETGALVGSSLPAVSDLASGTYYLIITDEKECPAIFEFVVPEQPLPDLVIPDQTVCEGADVTLTPTQTVSGASQTDLIWYKDAAATVPVPNGPDPNIDGVNYNIDEEKVLLIEGLPAGVYTYYLKIVCSGEIKTVNVIVHGIPNPVFEQTDLLCFGIPTGKITVTANGNPDFRYSINGQEPVTQEVLEAMDLAAGSYEIIVSQIGTTCTYSAETVVLTEPEEFLFEALDKKDPTCGSDDGMIQFSVSGGVKDYVITINNQALDTFNYTENNGVYTVEDLALGEYDIVVVDANDCHLEELAAFALVDDNIISVQSKNLVEAICEGEEAILIPDLTIAGAVTPTKRWYKDAALTEEINSDYDPAGTGVMFDIEPVSGQLTVYNLPIGNYTYYLEVSDELICTVSSRADVDVTPVPEPIFDKLDVLCFGEQTGRISVVSGEDPKLRYSVNGGEFITQNELEALGFIAGTYTIDYKHINTECGGAEIIEILQPDEMTLQAVSQTNPSCGLDDGDFIFTVTGGVPDYTITINNKPLADYDFAEDSGTYTVEGLALGEYDILVIDGNGCQLSEFSAFSLIDDAENRVQSRNISVEICEGEEAVFTPDITITGSFTPTLKWFFDEELTSEIPDNYNPVGSGIMYAIDPGTGEMTVYNLPLGQATYYLEISDDLICTVSSRADVTVYEMPQPEFETEDILCFGEEAGKINLIGSADPDLRFSIDSEPRITLTELEARNFAAGTYIIETFFGNADCSDIQTLEITQPEELVFEKETFTNPSCDEENGDLVFTVGGGTRDYTVLINGQPITNFTYSEDSGRYVVSQLSPGIYDIFVTDANGCTIESDTAFELVNFDGQLITAEPMEALVCEGSPLSFFPDFDSGTVNPRKRWFRNAELTQEIISNYNPTGTGVMYQIDPVTGALTVYNLPDGEYTYYLQLSDPEICTLVTTAVGTVTPGIEAKAIPTAEICFGDANGSIVITDISGGSGDYEFSLDNATWQVEPLFENLTPGTYTAYIRDLDGDLLCELVISNILVEGPAAAININDDVVIINASCDLPNGSIDNVQLSGGWGNFTVEWRADSPTGPPIAGNQNGAENLAPGKYFLLVTDEKDCEAIFEFEIADLDKPVYEPVAPEDICTFETNTLTVINTISGASSTDFTWSKDPNQSNPVAVGPDSDIAGVSYEIREELNTIHLDITGLPAGNYTYYFFAECTGQEIPISFEVYVIPDPEFEKTDISCFDANDGKIRVVNGGDSEITYSVNGGAFMTQAELEAMDLAGGDYTIIAKNQLDCTSPPQTITIINPDLLEIELLGSKNAACGSNDGFIEVSIKGGIPAYTLNLLKNGVSTQTVSTSNASYTFSNLGPGEYRVEMVDENNCVTELTAPVLIEEGPTEIIIEDNYQICEGEVLELKPSLNPVAANPVYTWYWMNYGAGNEISPNQEISGATFGINAKGELSITGLVSGGPYTVWVEVTGADICEGDLREIKINVDPIPVFTAEVTDEDCFGAGGEIRLIPPANQSNIKYSLNGGEFQNYSSNVITGLAPGSYTISAQNEFGCNYELPDAIEIVGPTAPLTLSDFEVVNATCGVNDGIIRGQILGGTPEYTITILDANGNVVGNAIQSQDGVINFPDLAPGNYSVRIVDAKGCQLVEEGVALTVIPSEIIANDQVICEGDIAVIPVSIVPSIASPEYIWYYDRDMSNPVQLANAPDQFGATYQMSSSGEMRITGLPGRDRPYSYFIMVEGEGICPPEVKEVKVTVHPKPILRVSNPSILCDPSQTVDLTQFIEGFNPNVFDYIVTSPNGNVMRLEDLASVSGAGNYRVQSSFKGLDCWTPIDRIVVIISDSELIADFQFEIQINGIVSPDADALMEEPINFKDLTQGKVIIWNWDFGDGNFSTEQNPVHQYGSPGIYTVKLITIDSFGCTSEIVKLIEVLDDYEIIIPNAFTPDGNKNTHFKPKYRGIAGMKFYIFNTWGDLIFESDSLETLGWDGTLNGQISPNGNYVYRAIFTLRSGGKVERTGVFILIR